MTLFNFREAFESLEKSIFEFQKLTERLPYIDNLITPHGFNRDLCGSPLEENLAELLAYKFPHNNPQNIFIYQQYPILNYRLDFLITTPEGKIGIEIDGKNWHDIDKDFERDSEILKTGEVDKIIRFPGKIMFMYPMFVLKIILRYLPYEKGHRIIEVIENINRAELAENFCLISTENTHVNKYMIHNIYIKYVPSFMINKCYEFIEEANYDYAGCECDYECTCDENRFKEIVDKFRVNGILTYCETENGKTN